MKVQPPYFLDRSLPLRVEKYMNENVEVDVDEMTDYLMNNYKEFSQKKRNIFRKSVQKAYDYEMYLRGKNKATEEEILEIPTTNRNSNTTYSPARFASFGPPSTNVPPENSDDPQIITDTSKKKATTPNSTPSTGTRKRLLNSEGNLPERRIKRAKMHFTVKKPTTDLNDLVGLDSIGNELFVLGCSLMRPRPEGIMPKVALVTGPTGSGKSALINGLAECVKASVLHVPVMDFVAGISGDSEEKVEEAFRTAISSEPCVLHLDGLDSLGQKENSSKPLERKICCKIISCVQDLKEAKLDKRILVLAETSYPEKIDMDLKAVFEEEIVIPPLNERGRIKVLERMTRGLVKGLDFSLIAKLTTSFVAGDLKVLVKKALKSSLITFARLEKERAGQSDMKDWIIEGGAKYCSLTNEELPPVTLEHFIDAIPEVTPVLKREGFPSVPEVTWDDIGGLEDIKKELKEKLIEPIIYPDLHKKFNATRPNGIIMWGPPGCGKTLLAKAVANQAGINFYPVNGPEVLNKFQGESERAIREIFQRASKAAPCIIFFDEFDSICPDRNKSLSESGSKTSIVNTLLAELEGTRRRDNVYVLAATNKPNILDPAVIRPGRFDTLIYVDLPDLKGRESIFKACTKGGTLPKLSSEVNLLEISKNCSNFSGADCSQLVYISSKLAIREIIQTSRGRCDGVPAVSSRHFDEALKIVKPSVSQKERRQYALLLSKQTQSHLSPRKEDCPVFEVEDDITDAQNRKSSLRTLFPK